MTTFRQIFATALFILISMTLLGQSSLGLLTSNTLTKDFEVNSKSNQFKVKDGKTKTLNFKIKKGTYYYVSINQKLDKNDVHYRISENGKLVYDNSMFEFNKESMFLCTQNTTLTVEIILCPDKFQRRGTKANLIDFVLATKKTEIDDDAIWNAGPVYVLN